MWLGREFGLTSLASFIFNANTHHNKCESTGLDNDIVTGHFLVLNEMIQTPG